MVLFLFSRESSIGSDTTLADSDAAPAGPPRQLSPHPQRPPPIDQSLPTGLKTTKASSRGNADTPSIGLRLSKARSYLHGAIKSGWQTGWQQIQHQRLTACQAAYFFVVSIILLVVGLITLLTSNQPTDVDLKSLETLKLSLEMQKALLAESAQAAKTDNKALDSSMQSLNAEKESLKFQRESLEREQSAFELQKQTLELAKWTAYHIRHLGAILSYTLQREKLRPRLRFKRMLSAMTT
ncbi:MAG: hypothetical protein Q9209_007771 [Squamulea sp. 1 TL-2023]